MLGCSVNARDSRNIVLECIKKFCILRLAFHHRLFLPAILVIKPSLCVPDDVI